MQRVAISHKCNKDIGVRLAVKLCVARIGWHKGSRNQDLKKKNVYCDLMISCIFKDSTGYVYTLKLLILSFHVGSSQTGKKNY